MRVSEILGSIVWSIEHQLYGPRFLQELGELWYRFWIKTPISPKISLCLFCKKEGRLRGEEGW